MYDNGDLQTPWGAIIYHTQGYKAGVECLLSFSCYRLQFKIPPPPPPPRSFHNLLIRPKLNPEKKDTRVIIFINSVHREIFICEDCDESENLSVYVYHSWRLWEMDEFSSLKSAASSSFRGSFYYSLWCMMKNWSWNQQKNIHSRFFL